MENKIFKIFVLVVNFLICFNLFSQLTTKWDLRYLDKRDRQVPYRIYEEDNNNKPNIFLGQFFGEIPFDAIDDKNIVLVDNSIIFTVDSTGSLDDVYQTISQSFIRLRVIKSSDGGINWYNIYPDLYKNYSNQAITSIQYLNNNWIFFSGRTILHKNINNLSQDNEEFTSITYSSDGGKNWTHCRIDTTFENEYKEFQNVTNIKMIDSLNGFAIINSHKNFKLISTNNCWQNYKIEYFTQYEKDKTQRAASLDIFKTPNLDSTVIAITDTRGYILISTDKGNTFRSIKISHFYPKQVKILNEQEFLILVIDSTIQDFKGRPQKGKYKLIKFNNKKDNYQTLLVNRENERLTDVYKYNENFISIVSGSKFYMSKNGGINWEVQDIEPYYIKYANENSVFALVNAYKSIPNTLQNSISIDNIALYRTKGNSTLKKPTIYINDNSIPVNIFTIDTTFCKITWNTIVGANYYFLTIYGEHKQAIGDISSPFYINNGQDNIWKKHEVIKLLIKDTSYFFQDIKRNMLYSIELQSLSTLDTLKSLPSIVLFKSDTSILTKPHIYNPLNGLSIKTKDILIKWHPVEGATGYNLEVVEYSLKVNKVYKVICKLKNYKSTNYLLRNLEPNKNYYMSISSMNDNDISDWAMINFSTESILSSSESLVCQSISFPNPARSTTRLNLQQEGQVSISAVDVLGRSFPLWTGYANADERELDVSTLPSGIYTLLIDYGTKREAVRLVKE